MIKNLLVFLFSVFLLFSCGKNNQKVISEPSNEEKSVLIYQDGMKRSLKEKL